MPFSVEHDALFGDAGPASDANPFGTIVNTPSSEGNGLMDLLSSHMERSAQDYLAGFDTELLAFPEPTSPAPSPASTAGYTASDQLATPPWPVLLNPVESMPDWRPAVAPPAAEPPTFNSAAFPVPIVPDQLSLDDDLEFLPSASEAGNLLFTFPRPKRQLEDDAVVPNIPLKRRRLATREPRSPPRVAGPQHPFLQFPEARSPPPAPRLRPRFEPVQIVPEVSRSPPAPLRTLVPPVTPIPASHKRFRDLLDDDHTVPKRARDASPLPTPPESLPSMDEGSPPPAGASALPSRRPAARFWSRGRRVR
ncbi:hypothetical protein HDU96_005415 [Phlyctochytrium bullatum]|nr:hypothetical protein HDU96_005415 [Phlyctochytrium bullatum]